MIKVNLKLDKSIDHPRSADRLLTLPFSERSKSRARHVLDNGEDAGLFLERGTVLRHGDLLLSDDGRVIEVRAAAESVSTTVHTDDTLMLARACYHLGNRHVALQIGAGWLRYQHDHVLDDMLRGFGLQVDVELAPFEPEGGAYVSSHAAHSHTHSHG
ncbi:MAG TPA: urease accessory protein UreE [Steroidobacteraceae bacterium]|nr:urease accessory protein UreE [Steroidobacteraceae bacterium]